jgi:hypothetical protein
MARAQGLSRHAGLSSVRSRCLLLVALLFAAAACGSSLPPKVRAFAAWKLACREEMIEVTAVEPSGDERTYKLECVDWNQDRIWLTCRNDVCRKTGPSRNDL